VTAMTSMPVVQVFLPGIVATRLDIEQIADGCTRSNCSASRLNYRFTYRVGRGGSVYGCRIKASRGIAARLVEQLRALVDQAETEGDSAMLVDCTRALEAIEEQTPQWRS